MTIERQIVWRSPPALLYKQSATPPHDGQRDSLHLAILGTEPFFCRDLSLAAALFAPPRLDGYARWRPEVSAVLMPGADVVLLDWVVLARQLPEKLDVSITQALVLISLVHGVEDPPEVVEFAAYCEVRDEATIFDVRDYSASDRDARQLRSWWKGS